MVLVMKRRFTYKTHSLQSTSLLAVMQKVSSKASNRECISWVWGITRPKSYIVGFGTDDAAKLAEGVLKGQLKEIPPWMEMVWCLAHRLELALKDALKNTLQLN